MAVTPDIRAVDRLVAAYSVALAAFWTAVPVGVHLALPLAMGHVALAFLVLNLPATANLAAAPLRWLREGYPLLVWMLAWTEVGWLHRLTAPEGHDAAIARLDRVLFGVNWHLRWPEAVPEIADPMQVLYLSYYALVLGTPVALAVVRRRHACRDAIAGLLAVYLSCFLIYLVYPVYGPRDAAVAAGCGDGRPLFAVVEGLRRLGDAPGTAFPSSHCAGATAAALIASRNLTAPARWLVAAWAVGITLSTIHTQNHYALDSAAGVAWAILVLGPGTRLARRLGRQAGELRRHRVARHTPLKAAAAVAAERDPEGGSS
jgi:membrane-associated phospholipid phosphatase